MSSRLQYLALAILSTFGFTACAQDDDGHNFVQSKIFRQMNSEHIQTTENNTNDTLQVATFGAGCFWCTEAQFQQLKGVVRVESGYMGGHVTNPSYKQVCTGNTGHAEVTDVYYNPKEISYDELLAAFWTSHDPTQLNRQGNDVGTQYRSAIFFHNDEQRQKAQDYKQKLNEEKAYNGPVVTEIAPASTFYKAEDYHQNYYNQNGEQSYCQFVVKPKLDKFRKVFAGKLKE
jgi:peptide-methionine (S)-S-oxide reductase